MTARISSLNLGVQLLELHLLAGSLERLGELGVEQILERLLLRRAHASDRLCDAQHVFFLVIHADEERDLDVRADVVLADQAFLAAPRDLDRLDREVHDLGLVHDRQHDRAGERDARLRAHLVDDHRATLVDLTPAAPDEYQNAQQDHAGRCDDDDECLLSHTKSSGRLPGPLPLRVG
jgi:hypothetical protein